MKLKSVTKTAGAALGLLWASSAAAQLPCSGNVDASVTLVGDVDCPVDSRVTITGDDVVIDGAGFTTRDLSITVLDRQRATVRNLNMEYPAGNGRWALQIQASGNDVTGTRFENISIAAANVGVGVIDMRGNPGTIRDTVCDSLDITGGGISIGFSGLDGLLISNSTLAPTTNGRGVYGTRFGPRSRNVTVRDTVINSGRLIAAFEGTDNVLFERVRGCSHQVDDRVERAVFLNQMSLNGQLFYSSLTVRDSAISNPRAGGQGFFLNPNNTLTLSNTVVDATTLVDNNGGTINNPEGITANYTGACAALPAGPDSDGDGVPDAEDNCPDVPNPDQTDSDAAPAACDLRPIEGMQVPINIADEPDDPGATCGDENGVPPGPFASLFSTCVDNPDPNGDQCLCTLRAADDAFCGTLGALLGTECAVDGDSCNCPGVPDAICAGGDGPCGFENGAIVCEALPGSDGDGVGDACEAAPDADGDGTPDAEDGCPNDANKIAPGVCGCGVSDADADADGTADCNDGCPADANKTAAGQCGCGFADTDGDADGSADCVDGCPADANKTAPGICDCGTADTDTDEDGVADCLDECPADPGKIEIGACGCGVDDDDTDEDGIADCNDADDDNDGVPDACGADVLNFDGAAAGQPLPGGAVVEGDYVYTGLGTSQAGYADLGNGDIGVLDAELDGSGTGISIRRADGQPFEVTSLALFNRFAAVSTSTGGNSLSAWNNGELVGVERLRPNAVAAQFGDVVHMAPVVLAGVEATEFRVTFFQHAPFSSDSGVAAVTFGNGGDCAGDSAPLDPTVCGDSDNDGCDDCAEGTDGFGPLADNVDGPDADGDGLCAASDACDADPDKTAPGLCGCGTADTDTDGDGTPDCTDECPQDASTTIAGACGCGVAETDTDADGTPDCVDGCPEDVNKVDPGVCGCGVGEPVVAPGADPSFTYEGVNFGARWINTELGDFDGDGDLDAASMVGNNLVTALNQGDGTFVDGPVTAVGSQACVETTVADVNGDGRDDYLCANVVRASFVMLGNADGSFTLGANLPVNTGVEVGDYDNDGHLDIVLANATRMTIFLGDGTGSFAQSQQINLTNKGYGDAIIADFNGDGVNDLLMTNEQPQNAPQGSIGLWDGATQQFSSHFGSHATRHAVAGDLDGDGDLDTIEVNSGRSRVWFNDGQGNFTGANEQDTCNTRWLNKLVDVDGDGDLDAIGLLANQGVDVCINDGTGRFARTRLQIAGAPGGRWRLASGDVNGDGAVDLAIGSASNGSPTIIALNAAAVECPDPDSDGDGTPDDADGCPDDAGKIEPGQCGCGETDIDTDNDGTADCIDGCPDDAGKTAAGVCGCGVSDADSDNDGTVDCNDGCPADADKTAAGVCGCGVSDADADGDGTADCNDGCPEDAGKIAAGICGCGVSDADSDGDGTADCNDGCPADADKTEAGICGCGVADDDTDEDGIADCNDACPNDAANDTDADGICGDIDNCPADANVDQANLDGDAEGDACDLDDDGDLVPDLTDNCPFTVNADQLDTDEDGAGDACDEDDDADGVADIDDNCQTLWNPTQTDADGNDVGDVCEGAVCEVIRASCRKARRADQRECDLTGRVCKRGCDRRDRACRTACRDAEAACQAQARATEATCADQDCAPVRACLDAARADHRECKQDAREDRRACRRDCRELPRGERAACNAQCRGEWHIVRDFCRAQKRAVVQNSCRSHVDDRQACRDDKWDCEIEVDETYNACIAECDGDRDCRRDCNDDHHAGRTACIDQESICLANAALQ